MDNYIVKIRHKEIMALRSRNEVLEKENRSLRTELDALRTGNKKNETKKEENKNGK